MAATLTAELNNGQLNRAVEESRSKLDTLGRSGVEAGKKLDTIGRSRALVTTSNQATTARTRLSALTRSASAAGAAIGRSFVSAGRGLANFGRNATQAQGSLFSLQRAALGLTAAFSFGSVISELRGFESTMAQVQGVTRATGTEFDQLQGLARDLGRNTQFSAQEAAEGVLFLARAGQDTNTILQTLPATLKFAQAGALELGQAADFATNIMGAFGLGAEQTEQSLNALVTVANNANTDITSLASAISFVGPAAESASVSLEDTAAAVGVLGDVGISASRAGTALNQILLNLSNTDPPDRVVATLEKLGLTINDVNPAAVGLETAFKNLSDAGIDLTDAARLVGTEASSALLALTDNNAKVGELGELARTTTDSLDTMANAMSQTLDGAIKRASSAFSGLIQEIGARGTTSILTIAFDGIANSINSFTDNLDLVERPIQVAIRLFRGLADNALQVADIIFEAFGPQLRGLFDEVVAGAGFLAANFELLEAPIQGVIGAFSTLLALKVAAFFVSTGLSIATSFANPVSIAVAAIGILAGVLINLGGVTLPDVIRAVATFVDRTVGFFIGLRDAAGAAFSNLAAVLSAPFQAAVDAIGRVVQGFLGVFRSALRVGADLVSRFTGFIGRAFDEVEEIVGEKTDPSVLIPASVRSGFADAAEDISDAFNRGLDFSGASDAVEPVLESLEGIGEQSEIAASRTARSVDTAEDAFQGLGETVEDTAQKAEVAGKKVQTVGTATEDAAEKFKFLAEGAKSVTGTFGQFFEELGLDIEQFARNSEAVARRFGTSFAGAFDGFTTAVGRALGIAGDQVGAFGGAVGVILDEIGVTGADIFETLGIDADSKFAQVAGGAFRVFARLADDQFAAVLSAGSSLISGLQGIPAFFTSVIPTIGSFVSTAVTAFSTLAASAGSAVVAMGPLLLVIGAIAAAVVLLIAVFGGFGEEAKRIGLILSVVFAPAIAITFALVEAIRFLIDVFTSLGDTGSLVATILSVVFAPVIIPIRLIIEAVQFLRDLFSGLGETGSTVAAILSVVLAPIVIPIQLIIQAVQFLIDLFGNLGGVVQFFGNIASAVFNTVLAVGQAAFAGLQAAGQALFGALSGIFNAIQGIASGAFNAILSAGRAAFSAIQSVASGALNVIGGLLRNLGGIASSVFSSIAGAAQSAFNAVAGAAQSAFNAAIGAARSAASEIANIFGSIPGPGDIIDTGKKAFKKVKKGFKKFSPFADGGLITGPVALAAPGGLTQSRFREGGLLDSFTAISDASKVTPTSQIGLGAAGEAGEEFIVPAARTPSGKLGITAIDPPGKKNEGGKTVVVNNIEIDARGAGDETVRMLMEMIRETRRQTPVVAAQVMSRMGRGTLRTA